MLYLLYYRLPCFSAILASHYDCLKKHEKLVQNLGGYEHLSSSSSPAPKALLDLQPLWSDLLVLEPSGMIHSQPLRQALLSLLVELPELNTTDHSGQVWCNLKVERLNCMLTHTTDQPVFHGNPFFLKKWAGSLEWSSLVNIIYVLKPLRTVFGTWEPCFLFKFAPFFEGSMQHVFFPCMDWPWIVGLTMRPGGKPMKRPSHVGATLNLLE